MQLYRFPRLFPSLFQGRTVQPIDDYPSHLLRTLQDLAPWSDAPRVVLLTPGVFNSAYFEHSYLAQQMGIALVEGRGVLDGKRRVISEMTPTEAETMLRKGKKRLSQDTLGHLAGGLRAARAGVRHSRSCPRCRAVRRSASVRTGARRT